MNQNANPPAASLFNVEIIRRYFPILRREVHGKPLIWLDSAATAQKPQAVIDRVARYYEHENSNIHRGTHTLATGADAACSGRAPGSSRSHTSPTCSAP